MARDKGGKMEQVAEQPARLVLQYGMDVITHARVARASGVSRPWLYKYIGGERQDLITFMATHFGMRLAELDQRPRTESRALWIDDTVEGLRTMARLANDAPWVLPLYFRYVGSDGPLGKCIQEIETRYLDLSSRELVRAGVSDRPRARLTAELIHAARLGIVHRHLTTGMAADPALSEAVATFRRWLDTL